MSFSGDNIVIKDDYTFERIENLKIGDCLIGPEGEVIITKIDQEYKNNNYSIKTTNFYSFYIGSDTLIYTTKEFELLNTKTNKYEKYLKEPDFVKIQNLLPTNLLCLKKINFIEEKNFENPALYGITIARGDLKTNSNNEKNLVIRGNENLFKTINKTNKDLNINRNNNIIFINKLNYSWIENINVKNSKKIIYKDLFISKKEDIISFINSFIKQNASAYLNNEEFRCYIESKILSIQLLYLILNIYNKIPFIEKISKDRVEYKKIVQADKKKKYSITMVKDLKVENVEDTFYQEIEKINFINKEIRMYNIETLDNKPFYLNNIIVKG